MSWAGLFFNPEGRINRMQFWLGWLILFGAGVLVGWIPAFGQIALLLSLYCHVCVYGKRLHDMGHTAWLEIIPFLSTAILLVVGLVLGGASIFTHWRALQDGESLPVILGALGQLALCVLAAWVIWMIFLLWMGCSRGQPGDNRYGPPPPATLG